MTILELKYGKNPVNIMLGDVSSVGTFGFEDLDSEDLDVIAKADCVCVFNWLYNRQGTDLAEKVFAYCRKNSRAYTFFDPSDPRPRIEELPSLAEKVLKNGLVDVLSVNENEAMAFAGLYERKMKRRTRRQNVTLEAGKVISANTGVKVYLHTLDYSASIKEDEVVLVPTFDVTARRGTGAGDCWNAGSMVGDALSITEEEKLLFANGVAAHYISNPKRTHSSVKEVATFMRDPTIKLKGLA
jgi:sugar/nucleoside kinase (ribokinase family)